MNNNTKARFIAAGKRSLPPPDKNYVRKSLVAKVGAAASIKRRQQSTTTA